MDEEAAVASGASDTTVKKGWASRHPKVAILLIAAVFYIILFGMCAFVFVLILRG
jgi:hypothetical protein